MKPDQTAITIDGNFEDWTLAPQRTNTIKGRINSIKTYHGSAYTYLLIDTINPLHSEFKYLDQGAAPCHAAPQCPKPQPRIETQESSTLKKGTFKILVGHQEYFIDYRNGNGIDQTPGLVYAKNSQGIEIQLNYNHENEKIKILIGSKVEFTEPLTPTSIKWDYAHSTRSGGDLISYNITTPPTIDGWVQESEYTEFDNYTVDLTKDFKIFIGHNATHTFIGIISLDDNTESIGKDACALMFDTENDKDTTPQSNDYKFWVIAGNSTGGQQGSGGSWGVLGGTHHSAKANFASGVMSYEFSIENNYICNVSNRTLEGNFGFGVELVQQLDGYWLYYPDDYQTSQKTDFDDSPDDWDYVEWDQDPIPEFSQVIIPLFAVMIPAILIKKRGAKA